MLKSHEKFHSSNGKRQILVADDELINREILKEVLKDDYEIILACDGNEAMDLMREHKETLSLVLLDILMPGMSGLEILKAVKEDDELSLIPIIVMTAEKDTEIESLKLGASDFIPKPYPAPGVIQARVVRTIELSEDREVIQATERDALTGLYNKEFFYKYAEQYDQHHKDAVMDAVVVDVNHFRMINERYGKEYGDDVLRRIGQHLREATSDKGGIVCRKEADAFLVYCPHRDDYDRVMESASVSLKDDDYSDSRVRLRMGVYPCVDKSIDIERRFDRAKMASDRVKGSFARAIGVYDNDLHKRQLYEEQLVEGFPAAIAECQFKVHYQPKFDVRPDVPLLTSAEALVRWEHPTLGMINPGVFIPLFEENGLIEKLDAFVWRETARQIREWKDRLDCSIPVSVNLSRVDMCDPHIADTLTKIIGDYDITCEDFLLEVTESAYTQDSSQIIETAENLRSLGFQIEMDDFGTGYSSLNMISSLPLDALKLDMQFIRNAFAEGGNTHMLEVVIGIADYLNVPVIAEGVETEEQLHALKALGCDIVQGYFFSRPVPAAEFEPFILQRKEAETAAAEKAVSDKAAEEIDGEARFRQVQLEAQQAKAAQGQGLGQGQGQNGISAIDPVEPAPVPTVEEPEAHTGIQLKTTSIFFVIIAFIAAVALIAANVAVTHGYQRMVSASDRYIAAQLAANELESGSDYLTDRVRCFVVTGEIEYLNDFIEEIEVTQRRDKAVENLERLLEGSDSDALANLNAALNLSNELVGFENQAMRLMVEAEGYDLADVPEAVASVELSPEDLALTPEQQKEKAQSLVFDNNYMHYKDRIREHVSLCTQSLIRDSSQELEQSSAQLSLLLNIQTLMSVLFLLIVVAFVVVVTVTVRKPLTTMVKKMQAQEEVAPTGVEELRFVTRTYNKILRENADARERLSHEASHDALTGLFNRGAYDLLMESADTENVALLLIDVDKFKEVNDTYGHAIGDRVLKRVAEILRYSFRSVDILCRIGGDEFAVVMTRANSSMKQLVLNKISRANDILQHPKDDLPPVSLSVGVAFSDRPNPQGDLFRDADTALYRVKEAGRNGCAIFE